MSDLQQGDVLLFQTNDDGEINVEDGIVEMSGGLETAAYLSLFGGNEQDDGREQNALGWWGNLDELASERQYVSETQYLLRSLPLSTGNLLQLKGAVERDLEWMLEQNIASSITVDVSIPAVNKIQIDIKVEAFGQESEFTFVQNWKDLAA